MITINAHFSDIQKKKRLTNGVSRSRVDLVLRSCGVGTSHRDHGNSCHTAVDNVVRRSDVERAHSYLAGAAVAVRASARHVIQRFV